MKSSSNIFKKNRHGSHANDDERWQAVVRRDSNTDGQFYYSVKTTGIYCRPSCGARPALRQNVVFYNSPEEAEKAGFRACQRCRPKGPGRGEAHAAKIAAACRLIQTTEELPTLGTLAKTAGMSNYYFHRVFKNTTGLTPKAYAVALRSRRVRKELARRKTVTEAIYGAGFNSNGRFYAKSSQMLGMKPKNFRDGGTGVAIRFAIGECSLGAILVAASEKGVCSIMMGDDPQALVKVFQDHFSKANLIGGNHNFERMVAKVVGFIEAPKLGLNLPLDVRGTAFQQRVWQALCKIPTGATASYAEIARRIGSPQAVRAVAGACAANAIAVAIPCHRVVRTDGSLSGYRWGVERKRALLEREAG